MMKLGLQAEIGIVMGEDVCEALKSALKPEADLRLRGVQTEVSCEGSLLKIVIRASDESPFLAAVNNILRLTAGNVELLMELQGRIFNTQ